MWNLRIIVCCHTYVSYGMNIPYGIIYTVRRSTPSYVFTSLLYDVRMFTHTITIELIVKRKRSASLDPYYGSWSRVPCACQFRHAYPPILITESDQS